FLSSFPAAQKSLKRARLLASKGQLQDAEEAYRDATYSFLWDPLVPDAEAVAAAREYAELLRKLGREPDAVAVENRLKFLLSPSTPRGTTCWMPKSGIKGMFGVYSSPNGPRPK